MAIWLLWIINKSGQLIYSRNFGGGNLGSVAQIKDLALTLAGIVYGLHGMSREISPFPKDKLECQGIDLIECTDMNVFLFETQTLTKFVFVTDVATTNVAQFSSDVYGAYIDYVLKNPFYTLDTAGIGQPIRLPAFDQQIEVLATKANETIPPRR